MVAMADAVCKSDALISSSAANKALYVADTEDSCC